MTMTTRMTSKEQNQPYRKLAAIVSGVAALALGACGAVDTASTDSALASATMTATAMSGGVLACAPSDVQITACSGKAAGDACSLTGRDGQDIAGTCRASINGNVGCAPNPPAPPQVAVDACASKASGDACEFTGRRGETESGVCRVAPDGATLACARTFTPPQAAVDACASKAKGDACTLTGRNGEALSGTCGYGPHDAGTVLACGPAGRFPDAAAACAGLAGGAACTLTARNETISGTCAADSNGAVVCVVACGGLGGRFDCGGHHGPGPGGPAPQ